ncbi:hypothetical protein CMI37_21955 [Candidatus Pacearchaeota archaeon]|nr:hypothetical protein [Candidatus Pacearchaeota archaeon]
MSERLDELLEQEDIEILNGIHDDEIVYVSAYYILDKDGKRVYDMEMIRQEFEENILILIDLNKQRGRSDGKTT